MPITVRGVTLRNRIGMSPMCQYSAAGGHANAWHLAHLAGRAAGGAGLVIAEATAVSPEGRISPGDLGLWSDAHVAALRPVAHAIEQGGAVPGIQLAHAGRKGSTHIPWRGRSALGVGGWDVAAPGTIPFAPGSAFPLEMRSSDIEAVVGAFADASLRASRAGFRFIELHFAHGYLVHQFLSGLTNTREDPWGGDFEGRTRLAREIVAAVRSVVDLPLSVRLSCVDWHEGGWNLDDTCRLAPLLRDLGADLIDCSSGGIVPGDRPSDVARHHGFAHIIRATGVGTMAVGAIDDPHVANALIADGSCDIVLLGRAMLRDPYWALHAAQALGDVPDWPLPYRRALR